MIIKNKITALTDRIKKISITLAAKHFSRKEKNIIIIVVFLLFLIAYIILNLWINKVKKTNSVIEPIVAPVTVSSERENKQEQPLKAKEQPPAEIQIKIRDPFLGSLDEDNVLQKPTVDLIVNGILWDGKIPTAIINSKVVKIGDIVFGKTVVDIEKDKVLVMENGQIYILQLNKQ